MEEKLLDILARNGFPTLVAVWLLWKTDERQRQMLTILSVIAAVLKIELKRKDGDDS